MDFNEPVYVVESKVFLMVNPLLKAHGFAYVYSNIMGNN